MNKSFEAAPLNALPTITYNDSITFYFNEDKIDVYHIPNAHTDGYNELFILAKEMYLIREIFMLMDAIHL